MNLAFLAGLLSAALAAGFQDINQHSEGWCSPNVADTEGSVTIVCQGVSPNALERLNELLDLKDQELKHTQATLTEKLKEAEEWARRYRELKADIAAQAADDTLAQQAEQALEKGDLEQAGIFLDKILERQEKEIDRTAANHFNRARVFQLQFLPLKALPHLEKAHRYRPENPEYAFAYAHLLYNQNNYSESEPIYRKVLTHYRQLAQSNLPAYLPDVAGTLNNLAILYGHTQRLEQAEQAYQEALGIFRELARRNPPAYLPDMAMTLHNLAALYRHTQRLEQAEQTYQEALKIRRELARRNPPAYLPYVAGTLNNLGLLYSDTQRLEQAGQAYQEALEIRRELARSNPPAYRPHVAGTLHNLGLLYSDTQRLEQAEQTYQEALETYRELARSNPPAYQRALANTLIGLARLYSKTEQAEKANQTFQEAVDLFGDVDALIDALK